MKYIAAFMLVAMAALASGGSVQMMELSPAIGSGSECEVALWCRDYATAARCGKVAYCRQWIWEQTMDADPPVSCDKCKEIVKKLLSENVTYIDDCCEFLPLPAALEKKCEMFFEKLISTLTPLDVCQYVHMCPKSQFRDNEPDENFCPICKTVAKELLSHLDVVKTALDTACKATGPVDPECELVVDALIAELKTTNASMLCKDLHVCTNASRPLLLGSDPCTQGPSYWCASPGNAKECAALEYCEKKYRL